MTQRLRWIPVAPPLADLEASWESAREVMADGLKVRAMNSAQDLHLRFSTDEPGLQEQFSGQFGQSLVVWVSPQGGGRGHGLRIDFRPQPDPTLNIDPVVTMRRTVTLLGPASEGYPRAWKDGGEGLELSAVLQSGALVYELRLPLAARPGHFGLGLKPGQRFGLTIAALRLAPLKGGASPMVDAEAGSSADTAAADNPYAQATQGLDTEALGDAAPEGTTDVTLPMELASPAPVHSGGYL